MIHCTTLGFLEVKLLMSSSSWIVMCAFSSKSPVEVEATTAIWQSSTRHLEAVFIQTFLTLVHRSILGSKCMKIVLQTATFDTSKRSFPVEAATLADVSVCLYPSSRLFFGFCFFLDRKVQCKWTRNRTGSCLYQSLSLF